MFRLFEERHFTFSLTNIAINYQLSTINCQLSTVNCQLSTINYQLSTVNCQLSTVNCQLSTVNCYSRYPCFLAKFRKRGKHSLL
ncbi:MAG: hypothetical protein EAZ90_05015 [Oscillatoriales cyanobacterium]|nr:MAG: hypothetical protein EAZ90_05015 [Oscillatoriales cyanobacterium]TAE64071.1 MAG: hypothetical protein EAZ86_27570 [Oscillatoriales cyanobacterium]